MLTDKRPVQWPHLTVTTIDKLLHGTLTYILIQEQVYKTLIR